MAAFIRFDGIDGEIDAAHSDVPPVQDIVSKDMDGAETSAAEPSGPMKESMETMKKAWKDASSGDVFDFMALAETDTHFDAQGRLLIGTEGGIWNGGDEDLLIGGQTTFDVDGDGKDDLATYPPSNMPVQEDWTVIVVTDHGFG